MSVVEYRETSLVHGVRLPFLRYLGMVLNYLHMGTWNHGMGGEKRIELGVSAKNQVAEEPPRVSNKEHLSITDLDTLFNKGYL